MCWLSQDSDPGYASARATLFKAALRSRGLIGRHGNPLVRMIAAQALKLGIAMISQDIAMISQDIAMVKFMVRWIW